MPPLVFSVWAAILVVPLLVAYWDATRVNREVAKAEHLAQDFIALCAHGDLERATSRCQEVGGALGQGVAEVLDARRHGSRVSQPALMELATRLTYPHALGCIGFLVLVYCPFAAMGFCLGVVVAVNPRTWLIAAAGVMPVCAFAYLANRTGQAARSMFETLRRIDQAATPPAHPGPNEDGPTGGEPRP